MYTNSMISNIKAAVNPIHSEHSPPILLANILPLSLNFSIWDTLSKLLRCRLTKVKVLSFLKSAWRSWLVSDSCLDWLEIKCRSWFSRSSCECLHSYWLDITRRNRCGLLDLIFCGFFFSCLTTTVYSFICETIWHHLCCRHAVLFSWSSCFPARFVGYGFGTESFSLFVLSVDFANFPLELDRPRDWMGLTRRQMAYMTIYSLLWIRLQRSAELLSQSALPTLCSWQSALSCTPERDTVIDFTLLS